jgi:hypothetical protein
MMDAPPIADLERTEIEASHAIFAAASPQVASDLGLASEFWDDAHFTLARGFDHPVFNRLHLRHGVAAGDDRIARAVARFRDAGVKRFFVQFLPNPDSRGPQGEGTATPGGSETGVNRGFSQFPPHPSADEAERQARASGLVPGRRNWIKLWRGDEAIEPPAADLRIEPVEPAQAELWAAITVRAFAMPEAVIPWFACLPRSAGWRTYLSFDGDAPVGGGAIYLCADRTAWLGMGGTLAEARGRGGQSAVLARRIGDALATGVRWMISETGAPVRGEAQTSFKNMQRLGFRAVYERANWGEPV